MCSTAKTVEKSKVLNTEKIAMIPRAKPKSPTRFTSIALIEALMLVIV